MFEKLNIQASVKSDRYSLPYHKEIEHTNYGESYLNGAYEPERFFRKVVKQLLDENVYKIRFYVLMEVAEALPMGKVNFKFRFFLDHHHQVENQKYYLLEFNLQYFHWVNNF